MLNKASYTALVAHGIKPTVQRLAVMGYLLEHSGHPTAEEIYTAMNRVLPTFSKATVYNTLGLLEEHGAVAKVFLDERRTCYDVLTAPHAHFYCHRCGCLHDVPVVDTFSLSEVGGLPAGSQVESVSVTYRGLCAKCQAEQQAEGHEPFATT